MKKPQMYTTVPEGMKALVTYTDGSRKEVTGPTKVFTLFGTDVAMFERHVLCDHESGTVYDENGTAEEVQGPKAVFVHPLGSFSLHRVIPLQPQEAMVVTDVNGNRTIYVGTGYTREVSMGDASAPAIKKMPQVVVKDREVIHMFRWTGSQGDTELKSPGSLHIQKLRLQETQTWFQVDARTKDGVMIVLNMMLFYDYSDVAKLLTNDDPLGVMYNLVTAAILKKMGNLNFETFRKAPDSVIAKVAMLDGEEDSTEQLKGLGITLSKAILRQWRPADNGVERIMAQEATITANQAVAEAQHQARLKELENEKDRIARECANSALRTDLASDKGAEDAARIKGMINALRDEPLFEGAGSAALTQLVLLRATAEAAPGGFTLTSESFVPKTTT